MNKLSVCIITLNEGRHLEKCIQSVSKVADEIIVVDSGSKDNTLEIAEKLGAKVFFRKFDNYANQKNYAMYMATGDWILALDGDEIIESALSSEIKEVILNNDFDAYSIPRKNIIFGKFIRYTRWQPELDRHVWLFKKEKSKWVGDVHEEIQVKGKVGKLISAKVHFQYETVSDFVDMLNRYSTLEAGEKFKSGQKFSYIHFIFQPLYNFFVRYIYRLGFLDGIHGFVLSMMMAIYHYFVWSKLFLLQMKNAK